MDIKKCFEYMKEKHGDQKRKHGAMYYTHPVAVAKMLKDKGFGVDYQVAGLFHDLLEDTDSTYDELVALSNPEVAEAVRLVTKEKGYDMTEYMARINANHMAKMVKLADRVHNLAEAKFASEKFQRKYVKETDDYFIDLAKGTVFEEDLHRVLEDVRTSLEDICL